MKIRWSLAGRISDERNLPDYEPWRYHFYFLSPEDYTGFFDRIGDGKVEEWFSGLMVELGK